MQSNDSSSAPLWCHLFLRQRAGWKLEGNTFAVSPVIGQATSLNSLAQGETAIGSALSPVFTLIKGENLLEVTLQGGNSQRVDGSENLSLRLVDAKTGKVFKELTASGSHILTAYQMPIDGLEERPLRLLLQDRNASDSYAWIGIRNISARAHP